MAKDNRRQPSEPSVYLSKKARAYFRDDLRAARANAFLDAEGFSEVIFAIERLGSHLAPGSTSLRQYRDSFLQLVGKTQSTSEPTSANARDWYVPFERLYDLVNDARNDALHQGAYARYLTEHAVLLAIQIEDALMSDAQRIGDFMVRDVSVAVPWQPVSSVRQTMLLRSFSFLPLLVDWQGPPSWCLISDFEIAKFLRKHAGRRRRERLSMSIQSAIEEHGLGVLEADTCHEEASVGEVLAQGERRIWLVVDRSKPPRLLGVVTPFDLV